MPYFRVWTPGDGEQKDDGRLVKAIDHEDAAKVWASWSDSNSADYLIVGGQEVTVAVAEDFSGAETRKFVVSGEPRPVYRARAA